jgi:hypothetical protein
MQCRDTRPHNGKAEISTLSSGSKSDRRSRCLVAVGSVPEPKPAVTNSVTNGSGSASENSGGSRCPTDRTVSSGLGENRPRAVTVGPFQRSREHRGHQVSAHIGVVEDLARFELLPPLEQHVDQATARLGSSLLNPPDMVIRWRRVTLAVSPLMASRCFGSNALSGWSRSAIRPSAIAIPIRIDSTLFVTENTWL